MIVNVIDLSSLLKITQWIQDEKLGKMTMSICVIKNTNKFELETIKLEILRVFKEYPALSQADKNVFLLGGNCDCTTIPITNTINKVDYMRDIKKLIQVDKKHAAYKGYFIQNEGFSSNHLNTLVYTVPNDIKLFIRKIASAMKMRGVKITEYSHWRNLDLAKYTIVSIERTYVRIATIDNGSIVAMDVNSIGGMNRFIEKVVTSNSLDDSAFIKSFEWRRSDIVNEPDLKEQLLSMEALITPMVSKGTVIIAGGGSNTEFLTSFKDKGLTHVSNIVSRFVSNELETPLMSYLWSSILVAKDVFNDNSIANLMTDIGSSDILEQNETVIKTASLALLVTSLVSGIFVNENRNVAHMGDYVSFNATQTLMSAGKYFAPDSEPIEYIPPDSASSVDRDGLDNLMFKLAEKVSSLNQGLEPTTIGGTLLNINTSVDAFTGASMFRVEETGHASFDMYFRGNVSDIQKVKSILEDSFTSVNYTTERIDDLSNFSVFVFKFSVRK